VVSPSGLRPVKVIDAYVRLSSESETPAKPSFSSELPRYSGSPNRWRYPRGSATATQDALIAALGGYVNARQLIPPPSRSKRGQLMIPLPALSAAKLALYDAQRQAGLSNVELGRRLGVSEGAVRRLLDLDHRSHIGQVESALAVLGQRLAVSFA
jgi:hypothetical protein